MSNTTAAINRLPLELLTDIFWLVIHNGNRSVFGHTISFTLTLYSVCSGWRLLILSNPSFWSSIPISDGEDSYHLTQLCLERSKDSPIDIIAHSCNEYKKRDWQGRKELVIHAHRVRSVDILSKSDDQVSSIMECILGDQVPDQLTHLSIRVPARAYLWYAMNHWVLDSDRISFKTGLTKLYDQLHTLHMGGIPLSNWWKWEGCSFSQLKELVLSRNFMNFEGTLQIVAAASNLQLLEFHELEELVADSTTLEPALKLDQGFKVLRMRQVSFEALFQELKWVVPGAWETELIVDPESFPHDTPSAPLFPNGSTVTTLSLINKTGDYPSLVIQAILKAFPNVQTLTLDGFNLTRSILSAITRSPNVVEGQFPRLSVLRLHSSRLFDYDTFMAMVMSHPIRRLEIWHSELQWNIETRAYAPVELSPLYPWLRERVPEIYIVGPYIET